MTVTGKKYKIEELKKFMVVKVSELTNILDTCMLLVNTRLLPDNDVEGTLVYYGDENQEEYLSYFNQDISVTPVYFDSQEQEDGVVYDE